MTATSSTKALPDLLKDVSRSFYLTLRALPGRVRPQISLAYLLARATDTIADTDLVPVEQRLLALQALQSRIRGENRQPLNLDGLAFGQGVPAERVLLENIEPTLALLESMAPADLVLMRSVLGTITSGQELDLRRFAGATAENVIALETDEELDDYTYRVAGCVGEFWAKMCRTRLFPWAALNDEVLLKEGIRFGKGLQLVNILRDLASDLRQGRCYLPREGLAELGLEPGRLREPEMEGPLRPLYNRYLDRAEAHLRAGWEYTNALPWRCARVRLACAWPILIGWDTLKSLRIANMLDPQKRVKVSRRRVRQIMVQSTLLYPLANTWKRLMPEPPKTIGIQR